MIVIETCPKCGHDLHDIMIATFPPIPKKECFNCGWSWEGEPEEVVRVPFGGNTYSISLNNYPYVVGEKINGAFDGTISNEELSNIKQRLSDYFIGVDVSHKPFDKSPCENCPTNPKNGGDGICFCTLGQMNVVY